MAYTRREFTALVAAGAPAAALLGSRPAGQAPTPRPNSVFAGVHVGVNAPYSFRGAASTADETIAAMIQVGASALELRSQPVEQFLGAPAGGGRGGGRRGGGAGAAQEPGVDALSDWRLALSMDRVHEVRRRFEDAGLAIEIVKFDGVPGMSDDVLEYAFRLTRALGASAMSCEIPDADQTARIGEVADRHKILVGYHGHAETGDADWLQAFSQAHFNGANVDIGHYIAGQNTSPLPFIREHHERITHLHLKDRRLNNGPNVPWGEGDTPIREALQMIRDNRWNIQATIELEYPTPEGSTPLAELARCVQFCREALEG